MTEEKERGGGVAAAGRRLGRERERERTLTVQLIPTHILLIRRNIVQQILAGIDVKVRESILDVFDRSSVNHRRCGKELLATHVPVFIHFFFFRVGINDNVLNAGKKKKGKKKKLGKIRI